MFLCPLPLGTHLVAGMNCPSPTLGWKRGLATRPFSTLFFPCPPQTPASFPSSQGAKLCSLLPPSILDFLKNNNIIKNVSLKKSSPNLSPFFPPPRVRFSTPVPLLLFHLQAGRSLGWAVLYLLSFRPRRHWPSLPSSWRWLEREGVDLSSLFPTPQ